MKSYYVFISRGPASTYSRSSDRRGVLGRSIVVETMPVRGRRFTKSPGEPLLPPAVERPTKGGHSRTGPSLRSALVKKTHLATACGALNTGPLPVVRSRSASVNIFGIFGNRTMSV